MQRLLVSCLLIASATSVASGFYFGDNGAKATVQGGAFTAQADDVSAIQHNPAGLTQLKGLSFLVDSNFLNNEVTFWRQDPGWAARQRTGESDLRQGPRATKLVTRGCRWNRAFARRHP